MTRRSALLSSLAAAAAVLMALLSGPAVANDSDYGSAAVTGGLPTDKFFRPTSIRPESMGIHAYVHKPTVPTASIRLACAPTWYTINPAPGVWDWGLLDFLVTRAGEWGYRDILFAFCGVPEWAREDTFGESGTLTYWREYVDRITTRYAGRIQHWEVWNEVSSADFYTGSPERMGEITRIVNDAVKRVDPGATVITPSVQTHQFGWVRKFLPRYLAWMKSNNWPADALGLHTYTIDKPFARPAEIRRIQQMFAKYDPPASMRFWDTEVNTEARPGRNQQAAILPRVFLDSWRLGIERTYWFTWTNETAPYLGVPMFNNAPAAKSWRNMDYWLRGARLQKCTETDDRVVCNFRNKGKTLTVVYAIDGKVKHKFAGKRKVCVLSKHRAACPKRSKRTSVGIVPVVIGPKVR